MWDLADRVAKTLSDVMVGTAIVLVHARLARHKSPDKTSTTLTLDGRRIWWTQISP